MSLSRKQNVTLVITARRGYDRGVARGQIVGIDFDTWRRAACGRAVGKTGFRSCGNSDYLPLLSHLQDLAGDTGTAFKTILRQSDDRRRRLEFVLSRTLASADLPIEYAESLSLDRWKGTIADLTDEQLTALVMTVKDRVAARLRKAESNPCPSVQSVEPATRNPEPGTALQIVNPKS